MITAVAIVCAVIVAGLLLHAWFDATGRELQSTVDRVLDDPNPLLGWPRSPECMSAFGVVHNSCDYDRGDECNCFCHTDESLPRNHADCRLARRDGRWADVCSECRPVVVDHADG